MFPRQSGKTQSIVDNILDNHFNNSLILCKNRNTANDICTRFERRHVSSLPKYNIQVMPATTNFNTFEFHFEFNEADHIYIDEYFFFEDEIQRYITKRIREHDISKKKIVVLTSPTYYDIPKKYFDLIRYCKQNHIGSQVLNSEGMCDITPNKDFWWNNLATEPYMNFWCYYDERLKMLGPDIFEKEFLGKMFKY